MSIKLPVFAGFFDNVEGEAVLELHARGAEDGSEGSRGATLLADDLADLAGGDAKAKQGSVAVGSCIHDNTGRIVHERLRDLSYQINQRLHRAICLHWLHRLGHHHTPWESALSPYSAWRLISR